MRAADLAAAARLAGERDGYVRLRDHLRDGERLSLMLGEGSKSVEIVLSDKYAASIRHDLVAAFEAAVADVESALKRLGVEP